ncbi:TetR/AcrR family transcriptional regulator [Oceanobacillus sp. CAU 1775]
MTTPRRNRTKEHFQLALIDLIKEKGFHAVTVLDIVEQAQYNRSTFYTHYHDKYDLAEDLLHSKLDGIKQAISKQYNLVRTIHTDNLKARSFQFIGYIYDNRNFFELIKYKDTIPDLHTMFPQTILEIYQEHFLFKTINDIPVNMDYFTRYTAYGFYGLLSHWINTNFETSQEAFIDEIIKLSKTHMAAVKYVGEKK